MNIVDDKLIYKDVKNKKLGYVIKEGTNIQKSNTMKFVTSRKKKSSDLGVMLNHQLNLFYCYRLCFNADLGRLHFLFNCFPN